MSWNDHPQYGGPKTSWWEAVAIILFFILFVSLLASDARADPYKGAVPTNNDRYVYKALVERVVDGDTVVLDIFLGFNISRHGEHVRLARIDAPEKRGVSRKKGLAAKAWLEKKILGKYLIIKTIQSKKDNDKKGSFGRYLVELFLDGKNVNDELVQAGHAVYRKY